jgi:hypothetical protein
MKTTNLLLTAAIALAFAAPASSEMCSTGDQAGFQDSRDGAEGRLSEVKESAASERAAVSSLRSQLNSIDFSKAPDSQPILAKAITTLETELGNVTGSADKYNSAYAAGSGSQILSAAQKAMASTANAQFGAARKSRETIAGEAAQVQKVSRPPEAMGLKSELLNRIEKARLVANYDAEALRDAGSAHTKIGDCAQKSEAAQNKGQTKETAAEKGGPARKEAEQRLAELNTKNAPDLSSAKTAQYGPGIGENAYSQTHGHFGALQPGDAALSPDLLAKNPYGSTIFYNGQYYRVADVSYISPGVPNRNMVEIWQPPR